jgi:arsenate reductase
MTVRILHNPRCSKSRATLALLRDHGIEPEIMLYLENPPDSLQLADICRKLAIRPRELLRTGEAEFADLGLENQSLSDAELLHAMQTHPRLIQRPIVLNQGKAAIGRPPEAVLAIL